MALSKIYSRINWENSPNTLLNERNLNRMDLALYELDNRVISQDATKANKTSLNNLISDWTMDEETGIITVTKYDGSKIMFDLNIEKIPVNFVLSDDGILTMTTDDGTAFSANIGAMIPVLTFEDSDTIAVSVTGAGVNKTYSFSIKANSVTADMLQPDYLAEVQTAAGQASVAASEAVQSAAISADKATLAKSYASGGTGTRPGEDKDNAYYYMTQAKKQTGDIPTFLSQLEDDIGFITEEEVNERLGDADISGIGDGTVTGAIEKVNNNFGKIVIITTSITIKESIGRFSMIASNFSKPPLFGYILLDAVQPSSGEITKVFIHPNGSLYSTKEITKTGEWIINGAYISK